VEVEGGRNDVGEVGVAEAATIAAAAQSVLCVGSIAGRAGITGA